MWRDIGKEVWREGGKKLTGRPWAAIVGVNEKPTINQRMNGRTVKKAVITDGQR